MEFLVKHWAPFPRHFPTLFPLVTAEYLPRKSEWVRQAFKSCNFSLILRGRGEFHRQGRVWKVEAPCVLTQWPDDYVEYGPTGADATWDEFYLIYDGELFSRFTQYKLVNPRQPVWPIGDFAMVEAQLAELEILGSSGFPGSVVDRVDRVCERMIMETRIASRTKPQGDPAIRRLIADLQRSPGREADFNVFAMQNGMSVSTFRRRWLEACKLPPSRFLRQVRLREARRLLAETDRPIGEIARAIGFEDELYFSRSFRDETKMPPRDYRKAYQVRGLRAAL